MHGTKQILKSSELRGLVKKIMATDPYGVWPRKLWERSPWLQRRVLPLIGVDSAVVYREPAPAIPFNVTFRIDPTTVIFDQATARLGYKAAPAPQPRDGADPRVGASGAAAVTQRVGPRLLQ